MGIAKTSRAVATLAGIVLLAATGCRSPYIDADVRNQTGQTVETLEVDYPSASFGRSNVAAGTEFHYRFKVLGSGDAKVTWTDASGDHSSRGPSLHEGQKGQLVVTLEPGKAEWTWQLIQ